MEFVLVTTLTIVLVALPAAVGMLTFKIMALGGANLLDKMIEETDMPDWEDLTPQEQAILDKYNQSLSTVADKILKDGDWVKKALWAAFKA